MLDRSKRVGTSLPVGEHWSLLGCSLIVLTLLISSIHNFAGAGWILFLGLLSLLTGGHYVPRKGFAAALLAIALFVTLLALIPNKVPFVVRIEEAVRFLAFAVFAILAGRLSLKTLTVAIVVFMAVVFLTNLAFLATGSFAIVDSVGRLRFSSILSHANHLGYVSAGVLVVFVAQFRALPVSLFVRSFTVLSAVLAIYTSQSAGAVLVAVLGLATAMIGRSISIRRVPQLLAAIAVLVVVAQLPPVLAAVQKILVVDLPTSISRAEQLAFGAQGSSFAWRISYWLALIDANVGAGAFHVLFGQGGGATSAGNRTFYFVTHDPHSDLIKVFVEYGLVGLASIFGILVTAVIRHGPGLVPAVVLIGPMLAGNSLTTTAVITALIGLVYVYRMSSRGQARLGDSSVVKIASSAATAK